MGLSKIQLTEQLNPLAQTFRVIEPGGITITGIGLFFSKAPAAADDQLPITIELRPTTSGGLPSSRNYISGTRVSADATTIRTMLNTAGGTDGTYALFDNTAVEHKFVFREPVYIPDNTEVAIIISTPAGKDAYKLWIAQTEQFKQTATGQSTEGKIAKNLDAGAFFRSSNGTVWTPDQNRDLAFKVYRAIFNQGTTRAYIAVDNTPIKALTENPHTSNLVRYPANPIQTTNGSNQIRIIHPQHGFQIGDTVTLSGLDSDTRYGGLFGKSINGSRTVDSADVFGYTVVADSEATSTTRAGGTGLQATEQYLINDFLFNLPMSIPNHTNTEIYGNFTTSKSFAGSETAGSLTRDVSILRNKTTRLRDPHVILSSDNETNDSASVWFDVFLNTNSKYVAPTIQVANGSLVTGSNFIDYAQSDDSSGTNRNYLTTIDWTADSAEAGGTAAAKHITVPYLLENSATSIRVMMKARRPEGSDFTVWYRTNPASATTSILNRKWYTFSKSINPPHKSNYDQLERSEAYREYEFNQFDLPDFNEYQIKITMNTYKSSNVPSFINLRTLATK